MTKSAEGEPADFGQSGGSRRTSSARYCDAANSAQRVGVLVLRRYESRPRWLYARLEGEIGACFSIVSMLLCGDLKGRRACV